MSGRTGTRFELKQKPDSSKRTLLSTMAAQASPAHMRIIADLKEMTNDAAEVRGTAVIFSLRGYQGTITLAAVLCLSLSPRA